MDAKHNHQYPSTITMPEKVAVLLGAVIVIPDVVVDTVRPMLFPVITA